MSRNRSAQPISEIGVIPSDVNAGQIIGMEPGHTPIRTNIRETRPGNIKQEFRSPRPLYFSFKTSLDAPFPPINDLALDFGLESDDFSLQGYEFIANLAEGSPRRVMLFGRRITVESWQKYQQEIVISRANQQARSMRRWGPIEDIAICTPKHTKEKAFALWDVGQPYKLPCLLLFLLFFLLFVHVILFFMTLSHILLLFDTHTHCFTHTHSLTVSRTLTASPQWRIVTMTAGDVGSTDQKFDRKNRQFVSASGGQRVTPV